MGWRTKVAQLLALVATTILIVEFGEFLLLASVWLFGSDAKVASNVESFVIVTTAISTVGTTLLGGVVSLVSIGKGKTWPSMNFFLLSQLFVVVVQFGFFATGFIRFESEWLTTFFQSKQPSFAVGMAAALVLIVVEKYLRRQAEK